MSCTDDMKTLLSRYVDGEMTLEEKERVDEHLAGCEGCRDLLSIFQKNENLLSNALSTESFGNEVVGSVVAQLKAEAAPPEARPVEEGAWERFRSRPLLQLAAAAVLVLGLVGLLDVYHGRQISRLEGRVASHEREAAEARAAAEKLLLSSQEQTRQMLALYSEQERHLIDLRTTQAIAGAGQGWSLTYRDQDHLVVKAAPDSKPGTRYEIYRRAEKDEAFRKMNPVELLTPEFVDKDARPGETYVYKFRMVRRGGEVVDCPEVKMRFPFPGDLSPEKSIRIHCEEIGKQRDNAKLILERVVNGKPVAERFYVSLGERVGGVRDVAGVGKVDFTTDLVLRRADEGTQPLTVEYTAPVFDSEGKMVMQEVSKGAFIPVTKNHSVALHIRTNLRAFFTPVGAPGQPEVELWKGSWIRVRSRD